MTQFVKQNNLGRDQNGIFVSQSSPTTIAGPTASENYLLEAITSSEDLSCTSYQLKSKIIDVHSEYHLSPKRANLVRAFSYRHIQSVFEFGCGGGSITRYLGEQNLRVDAIEPNYHLAQAAAHRCASLGTVRVAHAEPSNIEIGEGEYDLILCLKVSEIAQQCFPSITGEDAIRKLLLKVRRALTPNGIALIATENRTGFKYILGAHDDYTNRRYEGVHGYPDGKVHSYTRREWAHHISGSEFEHSAFIYPFPDYKLPTLLLSDEYVKSNQYAYNHLETIKSRDYISFFEAQKFENLFWEAAVSSGTLGQSSNSFCILLSPQQSAIDQFCSLDFAHLPGYSRNLVYSTEIVKTRGESHTRRTRLSPATLPPFNGISHEPIAKEAFYSGPLLSVEWSRALLYQDHDFVRFEGLIHNYYQYLHDLKLDNEFNLNIDLLPSNIIISGDKWELIDNEWASSWPIPIDLLMYRAMLMFAANYQHHLRVFCERKHLYSLWDFIQWAFALVGLPTEYQHISWLKKQDELFQLHTADQFTPPDLDAAVGMESFLDRPFISLFWRNKEQAYHTDRLVSVRAEKEDVLQSISIAMPPDIKTLHYLRLDPCSSFRKEGASFFRLSSIKVFAHQADNERQQIWSLDNEDDVLQAVNPVGIQAVDHQFGKGFKVIDYDAWLEFFVIPLRNLVKGEHFVVEIDIRYPRTEEYLLARDRYLVASEVFADRQIEMEATLKTLAEAQQELLNIKSSRILRNAEKIQHIINSRLKPGLRNIRSRLLKIARPAQSLTNQKEAPSQPTDLDGELDQQHYDSWFKRRPKAYWRSIEHLSSRPTVSIIVPVYRIPVEIFKQTLGSVLAQTYVDWELCIADDASGDHEIIAFLKTLDDPRIKITYRAENGNTSAASNAAAELATGEYLTFLDHDDCLDKHALAELVIVAEETGAEFIYSDEDFIHPDGHLVNPHFKPDFSVDLLLSQNYISHMVMVTRALFTDSGGFRPAYEGAQDYDLFLRLTEKANRVSHLPKPLYHRRMLPGSTAQDCDVKPEAPLNARQAVVDTLARRNIQADVLDGNLPHYFRVKRHLQGEPLISIIIPFKDHPRLLKQAIQSILEQSTYSNFEIIGVSNDTTTPSTMALMKEFEESDSRIKFIQRNEQFNFSYLVNCGAKIAKGEHLVLFNNDIQIITPGWIEALLEHSQRDDVAVVGAKLYYPDNTIQHAGIGIGLGGCAGHFHLNTPAFHEGYFNRLQIVQNVSAVTGALMMVSKEIYHALGGFDEESFKIAYNDVDFCLKARREHYLNVFTPYCEAYHHESKTRGYENTVQKSLRFEKEKARLVERYKAEMDQGDPYYNVNLDQGRDDFKFS